MKRGNSLVAAFTGHRKERMLQGGGNNPRLTGEIRNAVLHEVVELYKEGYRVFYTGLRVRHDGGGSRVAGKGGIWGYHARGGRAIQETALAVRRGRPIIIRPSAGKGGPGGDGFRELPQGMLPAQGRIHGTQGGYCHSLLGSRTGGRHVLHGKKGTGKRQACHQHP